MATKILINIKTEREVKENAQKLARELGLSLSDVMNAALRNFVRTREVTFSAIPRMTPELEKLVGRARQDFVEKKNVAGPFFTTKEAEGYLDSL